MKDEKQINQMSPLTWAYVGDAVYELYVRNYLIDTTDLKPNNLHRESIKYVKAKSQSEILRSLQEFLTEKEQDIVRRTRNTQNHHLPKNANVQEYMYATALEGLIGYLYLTKQKERLDQLFNMIFENSSHS